MRPFLFRGKAHNFDDSLHLISLEWNRLFGIHLGLFAFEDGPQRKKFRKYTADSPHVHRGGVMPRSKEEFWSSVPDGHNDFVAGKERMKRFIEESGKTEITYLDLAARSHHDVCWLQIPVKNPIGV